jgi:HSP20 family molecular chaperone IbpA
MTEEKKKELEVSQKRSIDKESAEPTHAGVTFVPDVDIVEADDRITLYADLPGVSQENLDIDLREGVLTLTATVNPNPNNWRQVFREYDVGGFQRRFNLGERIDQTKIGAKLDNGVLELTLPKAEAHQPRKIKINN